MQPDTRRSRFAPRAALLVAAALAGAAALFALPSQAVPELEDLAAFPRASLEITSAGRVHRFEVWVADTPQRQAQGLMFVRDLAADSGMLFVHDAPREVSMWMKNTYIALDMLFIDRGGRIVRIARETTPHSLESIHSGSPVTSVLELRGGEAARRGIEVGDRVKTKL